MSVSAGVSSVSIRWSPEQTMKFVKEYLKREQLYNSRSTDYRSKYSRRVAFKEITEIMNIRNFGPCEIGNKIKNIRSTYSQELKKIRLAKASGREYVPNLAWFKLYHRAMHRNLDEDEVIDESMNLDVTVNSQEIYEDQKNPLLEESSPYAYMEANEAESSDTNVKEEQKTFLEDFLDEDVELGHTSRSHHGNRKRVREGWEVSADLSQLPQRSSDESEFDVFGKSVAAQLKNMPLRLALEAEKYIQNYLSNLRLQMLDD